MQKIPVDKAKSDMVLAKPVLRENGTVLIAENTKISNNIISTLKKQGIKFIVVKGSPLNLGDGAYGFSIKKRLDRLDYLFRNHKTNPWMQKVKKFFEVYFKYKIQQSQKIEE